MTTLRFGFAALVATLAISSCRSQTTFADVLSGRVALDPGDLRAVGALLREAGVEVAQFSVVGELERLHGNGVVLESGRVVHLALTSTHLSSAQHVGALPKLRCARLEGNALTSLRELSGLAQLKSLHVNGNRLRALDGLEHCTALAALHAGSNQITSFEVIAKLGELRELGLRANVIESLPDLTGSAELTWLDLSSNRIRSLASLGSPPKLAVLLLNDNALTTFADAPVLATLEHLLANNNAIESIEPLLAFPALRTVHLEHNRISHVPTEARRWTEWKFAGNPQTQPDSLPPPPPVAALDPGVLTAMADGTGCTTTLQMPCRLQFLTVRCQLEVAEVRDVTCVQLVADRRPMRKPGGLHNQMNLAPHFEVPLMGEFTLTVESGSMRAYLQPVGGPPFAHVDASPTAPGHMKGLLPLIAGKRGLVLQALAAPTGKVEIEFSR